MNKNFKPFRFKTLILNQSRLAIKLDENIINRIYKYNNFFKTYFFFIANYIKYNNLFLEVEEFDDEEPEQYDCIQNLTYEFETEFCIEIEDVIEEIIYIPINLYIKDNDEKYFDKFNDYLLCQINKNSYERNMVFYDFISKYNLIPLKKDWIVTHLNTTINKENIGINYKNFMNNELLRKYSLEDDIRIFNKNGREIISIEDDKSPLFMFLEKTDYNYFASTSEKKTSPEKEVYFINPNMAKIFRGNVLSIDLMLNMLGYSTKEIFELISKVSNKKLSLAIIGLGGTMSNFVYFVTELAKFFRLEKNVFKNVVVYEDDLLELSNLPRIPLDYITPIFTQNNINRMLNYKVNMLYNVNKLADNVISCTKKIDTDNKIEENFNFIIGTPDIITRTEISKFSKNFICPMHSDNELYIYIAPEVVGSDLMYETYGRIRLSKFFFNMLEMTIQCLKIMLYDDDLSYKAGQMVYQYSIDNIDIDKNMNDFKRKERVMI